MRLLEDRFRSRVPTIEERRSAPAPGLGLEHSRDLDARCRSGGSDNWGDSVKLPLCWSFTDSELAILWKKLQLWYN